MTKEYGKIIVIVGQTASGKSDLAVKLAKKINAEIVSADSRQVYKELNLTSGKITKEEMGNVPHYLLNVLSVKDAPYSAFDFSKDARMVINNILKKGKHVIIVGGTGFYIDAALGELELADVPKNENLREKLQTKNTEELYLFLKSIDPQRASLIDKNNKVRLIRAIEIAVYNQNRNKLDAQKNILPKLLPADIIWIGIKWPKDILRDRIKRRLFNRHTQGMCKEIKNLLDIGISKNIIDSLGLEARYCLYLIEGKMNENEFLQELENKIWQYAKRQATYWRKNKKIKWFHPENFELIYKYVVDNISK